MAPRSIKGFNSAIQKVEEELTELDQKLQAAEADSTEEEDLIAEKAEKSLKLQQLKDQFEEFKTEQEESGSADDDGQQEDAEKEPEEVWPETMYVRARNDIGFMVNPYTHDRISTDFKKVVVDKWLISQVKAGFLLQDKD